jgi:hypothetical protein
MKKLFILIIISILFIILHRCGSDDSSSKSAANPYKYIAADNDGLLIVDVSDPADPVQTGHFAMSDVAYGVY